MISQVQMGMVDRGADIAWLSQYPHEEEILFPPLTSITVEEAKKTTDELLLLDVRLNINVRSQTLEQESPSPLPPGSHTSISNHLQPPSRLVAFLNLPQPPTSAWSFS